MRDKGIIHRDLKPANIKVTPYGQVKILDFGLAKAMSLELSNSSADAVTMPVTTSAGLVLGTAAYMSPEQARGQEVDRRSDVWSFGVVMYEMLTGKRPFAGQTISDTLAAVLREAPDLEGVPPRMRRLVAACLEKDRRERLRDLGDVRLLVGIDSGEPGATAAAEALPKTTRQRRAVPWAVASLLFAVAIVFAVAYFRKSGKPQGVIRSMIAPPEGVTFAFGDSSGPVLSPDGTRLIFPAWDASGKEALWVRSLDSLTAQRLEGTEGASYPFWSPDSGHVGFFQAGKLKEIDVTGGPPVVLCDAPDARGGTWGRTNTILFASRPFGGLESVPATGGQPTPVSSPVGSEASFSNRWPEFLPDGKHFIFLSGDLSAAGTNKIGIYTGEIGSKESRFLLQADSDALYVPPGYLLFLRGDTLMAQRFDAESEKPEGEAFPLVQHVDSPALYRLGLFSASATGLLVYETAGVGPDSQMAWYTATGKQLAEVGPSGLSTRASPRTKNNSHT